jgi:hypothetical protein
MSETDDTNPLPYARDFWKGGEDNADARVARTEWPAEWRVPIYCPGLPIEQTNSRTEDICRLDSLVERSEKGVIVGTSSFGIVEAGVGDCRRLCFRDIISRLALTVIVIASDCMLGTVTVLLQFYSRIDIGKFKYQQKKKDIQVTFIYSFFSSLSLCHHFCSESSGEQWRSNLKMTKQRLWTTQKPGISPIPKACLYQIIIDAVLHAYPSNSSADAQFPNFL